MDIEKYLQSLKDQIFNSSNWKKVELSRTWASKIPIEAGVYILLEGKKVIYVGETGSLRGRMFDLLDSRHHTVRRTIGEKYFSSIDGFIKATTKNKFPPHIEDLVNEHIHSNLTLAYMAVPLGRKELEEFIEKDIPKEIKLNKRGKRK